MISIIIPTHNHLEDLLKPCIESIIRHTDLSAIEIIVVANGCIDGTEEYVTALGAPFKLVSHREQLGYTKATNLGIAASKGDFVLLLNNDTVLLDQERHAWIKTLVSRISPPDVGICAVSIKVSEYTDRVFGIFFCTLIKREVIDKIGVLDEIFSPGYGEDMDFCHRAEDMGYKTVTAIPGETQATYETEFPIYHAGSVSVVADLPDYLTIVERNGRILRQKYVLTPLETQYERFVAGKEDVIGVREAARYRWAREHLQGTKILEIGCSSGFGTTFLKDIDGLDYTGVDYNKDIVEFAKKNFETNNIRFEHADINTYTIDTHYDTIIAFEIMEHLENGRELAQQLKQHCDCLLVSTPHDEITFVEQAKNVPGVNWGIHHRLHHLTKADFPGFAYYYMSPDGEIDVSIHNAEFNLMLLKYTRISHVSVVVISHDYGRFLEPCLESIINQKLGLDIQKYQIILLDNNSTDNTMNIFNKYRQRESSSYDIEVLHVDSTLSIPEARNFALDYAQGNYICFVDADDFLETTYLNTLIKPLQEDFTRGFAYSDFIHFSKDSSNVVSVGEYSFDKLQKQNFILNSALIRTTAIQQAGGYDVAFADGMEDYDLWLTLAENGWTGCYVPEALYNYRIHEHNRSNLDTKQRMRLFKKIRQKHRINLLTVAATVSTKDRYFTTLPSCLLSLAHQTVVPDKIIIYDDGEQLDLREHALYANIFKIFDLKGIEWEVRFGERKGQVHNHIRAIEELNTEFIWRVDDDNYMEPGVLEELLSCMGDAEIGAVGSLALVPTSVPHLGRSASLASGKIELIETCLNLQWLQISGIHEVEHLHNTFLFRRVLGKGLYPTNLSPVGHREETIFTHRLYRKGYKLLVNGNAVGWHLRAPAGGIRSFQDSQMYEHDEQIFKAEVSRWNSDKATQEVPGKLIVLDSGLGDHYAFKHILGDLIEKHGADNITLAVCYPEVFEDVGQLRLISIAQAKALTTAQNIDFDSFNIYKWMWDRKWTKSIVAAYKEMYDVN